MERCGFSNIMTRALGLGLALATLAHASTGGPFGGSIFSLQADPTNATRVYASTSNGFFRSDDGGTTWAVEETGLLIPHPTNGVFTVSASVSGGLSMFDDGGRLYRSSDAGNSWTSTGYVATTAPLLGSNSLAQGGGSTVWFAANTGGLLVSANNGATFAVAGGAGFPAGQTVTYVATNPGSPSQVVAGTASNCDGATGACPIYFSSTGGTSWSQVTISGGLTAAGFQQRVIAAAFGPAGTVYALYNDPNYQTCSPSPCVHAGSVLSGNINVGASWTAHTRFGVSIAATPSNALTVWVDANKSIDGGTSFNPLATSGRNTNGIFVPGTTAIAVSPNYASSPQLWIGTQFAGMYLSNNDGAGWTSSNDGMVASDIRTVVVHPADNTVVYAGYGDSINDPSQAFYRSALGGTWSVSNSGLNAYQLRTLLIDPTTAGTVGGTVMFAVGSGFDSSGGPFAKVPRNSGIYKSSNGGSAWTTLSGGIPVSGSGTSLGHFAGDLRTIIADPRSCASPPVDGSVCISGPLRTLYVTGAGVPTFIPPGLHPYRVMKSTDGGDTWADSSVGLPNDTVNDVDCTLDAIDGVTPIVMDPSNSSIMYIGTFAEADDAACNVVTPQVASGVYKSTDAGAHWTLASAGLPTYAGSTAVLDTLSLAIDPAHPQTLWVSTKDIDINSGTPGEIYKTTNSGALWAVSNAGVTGPDVRALLVDPSTTPSTIYAASGGVDAADPGGVYKSTDGGTTWKSISVGLPAFSATALTLDPTDPTVLYAGTTGGVYSLAQLPDSDGDGVPDAVEDAGPNNGDANHNGIMDKFEPDIASIPAGLAGSYGWQPGIQGANRPARLAQLQQALRATPTSGGDFFVKAAAAGAATDCGQTVDVTSVDPTPFGDDSVAHHGTYSYPNGLLHFELPQCAAATVDVVFTAAMFGPGWSWRYFGPATPGDESTMGWHDATSLVVSRIGGDWMLTLVNGQFGSYRPAISNSILFEGGPAYNETIFNDTFE